jgi:hypothetical protein
VAWTAQQSIILETTFAATVSNGNDVIRLPARSGRAPRTSGGTISDWRFRACPLPVRFEHVERANLTNTFVPLPDLLAHVPRTAAYLPFVHAGVAAECTPWKLNRAPAPPTDRFAESVALGLAPLFSADDTPAASAHAWRYRQE